MHYQSYRADDELAGSDLRWAAHGGEDAAFFDEEGRRRLTLEQIRLAARNLVVGISFHAVLVLVLYWVLSFYEQRGELELWAAFLIVAASVRSVGCHFYLKKLDPDLKAGRYILIATALLMGSVWGAMPWFFFAGISIEHQAMIILVLGSMCLGSLIVTGYYLPSYYAVIIPALIPPIFYLAVRGDSAHIGMAAILVVVCVAVALLGMSFGRTLSRFLRVQIVRDILLERLQDSRHTIEAALKSGRDSFAIFDRDGRLILWNEQFFERFKDIAGPIEYGTRFKTFVTRAAGAAGAKPGKEDEDPWYIQRMAHHRNPGLPFEEKVGGRWLLVQEVRTARGHTVLTHTDITELKKRELALRDSEAAKTGIVQGALDGVITVDETGRVTEFNEAASRIFGWDAEDVVGRSITDTIVPLAQAEPFRRALRVFFKRKGSHLVGKRREILAFRRDGSSFPAEISLIHVVTASGKLLTAFIRDIGDRLDAERRLLDARDEAQAASRAKSEFLATISHEIRTPMNGLLGSLDLLLDGSLEKNQRHLAATARDAGEALRGLLDDILDFSKMEAGKLEIVSAPFSPKALVESCRDVFQGTSEIKNVPIRIEFGADIPEKLDGDASRLRQILLNLIGNAMKFTSNGHITVRVDRLAADAKKDGGAYLYRFEVADTGIGISEDFREGVFATFSQADPGITRKYGGSGLGLAIVKGLTVLMGGSVDYESEPNRGSRFWCDIPLESVDAVRHGISQSAVAYDKIDLSGVKVLVVDDSAANRLIASEMLRRSNAVAEEADNGADAVEKVKMGHFNLVLMDISMPGMDGVEAFQKIRAAGFDDLPVVALTAQAGAEARQHFADLGFTAFLSKPVHRGALLELVYRLAGAKGGLHPALTAGANDTLVATRSGIDFDILRSLEKDLGREVVTRLLGTFLDEAVQRRDAIRQSLRTDDFKSVRLHAHALKSAAASFGAGLVSLEASIVEKHAAAENGQSIENSARALDLALEDSLRDIRAHLAR